METSASYNCTQPEQNVETIANEKIKNFILACENQSISLSQILWSLNNFCATKVTHPQATKAADKLLEAAVLLES